jgi:SAM-dependent methyltransferase
MKSEDIVALNQRRDHYDNKTSENEFACLDYFLDGVPIDEASYDRMIRQPVIQRLELEPYHRVLDVGCGTGLFLNYYESIGCKVFGTDISKNLLSRYKGKAKTYVCAAHEMPFEPRSFDRISMVSVAVLFPSFDYFKIVIDSCINLLNEDGILIVGDQIVSTEKFKTQYLAIDTLELIQYLEYKGHPYSICAHNREKRVFSKRKDILIYRDKV